MVVVGLTLVVMVFQPLSLRLEAFLSFEYKERGEKSRKFLCTNSQKTEIVYTGFNKFLSFES